MELLKKTVAGVVLAILLVGSTCRAAGFTDVTSAAGISHTQWLDDDPSVFFGEPGHMSGGAAAGDFDGDGWVDLFFTRLDGADLLYRNRGDGTFEDVSAQAGFTSVLATNGAVWADLDNDGDQDLYVTALSSQRNYLYINDGAGGFTEQAVARSAEAPTGTDSSRLSPAAGDYDRDGYLDLFTSQWGPSSTDPGPLPPHASRLLRNVGAAAPATFTDTTVAAGVDMAGTGPFERVTWGFAPRFTDLDNDGVTDLIVASDFGTSRLFWGDGDGTFTDGTATSGVGTDENGMGSTVGDYNGDGLLDWFVTSIFDAENTCATEGCNWGVTGNRLYENQGGRTFADATDAAGVRDGGWGWGTSFLDYDNDGDLDLAMTNGVRFPFVTADEQYENDLIRFWRNDGGASPTYTEVAAIEGVDDDGSGKGLLTLDYDRDGDLDFVVVNNSASPILYRNDSANSNAWLQIRTEGVDSNRDGIGARVTVVPDLSSPDEFQVREIDGGSNFLGQNERIAHFGFGDGLTSVDKVSILWPSGHVQNLYDVSPNQLLDVLEAAPGPTPGDYNGDGVVDARDFIVWRDAFAEGAVLTTGEAASIGVTDHADYLAWVDHFGSDYTSSVAIPEPSAIALVVAALGLSRRGRRR